MTLQQGGERDGNRSLDDRLRLARSKQGLSGGDAPATSGNVAETSAAVGIGLRVGVELVSALAVGLGIGWLLDRWLHTTPVFLAVFVLLGGAAGIANVWRLMGSKARPSR